MSKFTKAVDFYLRGFNSAYIKSRTGISMQFLLKQLKAQGIQYTKDDIFKYQLSYVQSHFSEQDVEQEYRRIMRDYPDPYKASRGRHVTCLGCGFGDYKRVMQAILGKDRYSALRNECWKEKQVASVQALYGVSNVFQKEVFSHFVSPEAVQKGRKKREDTLMQRYGVVTPNAHPEICSKMLASMKATNMDRYGVEDAMQCKEIAQKSAERRMDTMLKKYGAANSVEIPAIRNKIFDNRRRNHTLNSSAPEEAFYELLVEHFGVDDVKRNVLVDGRYPFHVDFYIVSRDMFIELNGDRSHNDHWFDADNARDQQIVRAWEENAQRLEAKSGKKSRYRKYIQTWTDRDVRKRHVAAQNHLNYLVFWDSRHIKKDGRQVPRLLDARAWLTANCPDSWDWESVNTY